MQPTAAPGAALAQALRSLREAGWSGVSVTQAQVARALNVSEALVSTWENIKNPRIPPVARLTSYATFFATPRSIEGGSAKLLDVNDLTSQERARRETIVAELRRLRTDSDEELNAGDGQPKPISRIGGGPWHFPDERSVTIACTPLAEQHRKAFPYGDPSQPDHAFLHTLGDPDALLELYGHVKAVNPDTEILVRDATRLRDEDYTNNLVLLGGVDWNEPLVDLLELVRDLPVRQLPRPTDEDIGGFEVTDGTATEPFRPIVRTRGKSLVLVEDVAHFFRGPNPYNRKRTVTICNGMFGRGTYGIVRALTDPKFRDRNAEFLAARLTRFEAYSLLSRVRISTNRNDALTPDWTAAGTVLHEWPGSDE